MEKMTKLNILKTIGKIYEASEDCKLEDAFFSKLDDELTLLSEYFQTTKKQSFFISLVFVLNHERDTVDIGDLSRYLSCNPIKILEYSNDFEYLYTKGFLEKRKLRHRINRLWTNNQFVINEKILKAVLQNKPIPETTKEKFKDIFDLLAKLYNIGEQRDDNEISTHDLFIHTKEIINENQHFPLIKRVHQFGFDIADTYLYLYLIWKTLSGGASVDINRALEGIYDNPSKRVRYMQKILSGENILLKNNLIELIEARFFNDTQIALTDKSHNILNECEVHLFSNKKLKKENVLLPQEIPARKLFFRKSEMRQLFLLKDLLDDKKLRNTQKRLTNKNLPKGITALLHGAPGTGKTEIVKQIAKETNRDLIKVEISQSKSMWFGESEKIIKRIFTDYKTYADTCERMPILFFNEADAIFSKRRELETSSVVQTENAMQNILLEELENFEGILIATTNLAKNIDLAFERRFLFKIQFRKPNMKIRTKIWKSKLPFLKKDDCNYLAESFELSGGQIDNIIRKSEIHEIINGKKVNLENITNFCLEEEISSTNNVKIGFKS